MSQRRRFFRRRGMVFQSLRYWYTNYALLLVLLQSLIAPDAFTHILRVLNTNVDGKQKIMYALTAIKGLGRRFSNICCKKAEVDLAKRYA